MARGFARMMAGSVRVIALGMAFALCITIGIGYAYGADDASDATTEGGPLAGAAIQPQEEPDYDISWYTGKESPYTVSTFKAFKGFAYLVNSGTESFEGKTVRLSANLNFRGQTIDPIGTPEHPFEGTFDGGRANTSLLGQSDGVEWVVEALSALKAQAEGGSIFNYTLHVDNTGSDISYKGLFGYAGEHATIQNLLLQGSISDDPDHFAFAVTNTTAGKRITDVGAIAGHLGGDIINCKSTVDMKVANNGEVPANTATLDTQTTYDICSVLYVGGLVGSLGGDMVNCEHGNSNGVDEDATLFIFSNQAVSYDVPYIASYVGGLVGKQGDEAHGELAQETTGCKNYGALKFDLNGAGVPDRFGNVTYARSAVVGGIAGYSSASFTDCANAGTVNTGILGANGDPLAWRGALNTGGIVGSLRGPAFTNPNTQMIEMGTDPTDPGYDVWLNSKGQQEAPLLSVKRCINTGYVVGLAAVGGIIGTDGAFTEVIGCVNSGRIDATRSTKPCPAGIVGVSNGDIAYCASKGAIRTTTGAGYYASGIASLLTTYNISGMDASMMLDQAEIYGCYVSAPIISAESGGFRSAVIAAENDGRIHDNCYLPNLTTDKAVPAEWQTLLDCIGNSDGAVAGENVQAVSEMLERVNALEGKSFAVAGGKLVGGTKAELERACTRSELVQSQAEHAGGMVIRNTELTAEELKSSLGVAILNRGVGYAGDWSENVCYFCRAANGFPVLNWQTGAMTSTVDFASASGLAVSVASNPVYSASNVPVPTLNVTLDGQKLYQNADYRVAVSPDAREVGQDYQASIVGMNGYAGTCENVATYQVDKCDVSSCKVLASSQTFNWGPQTPSKVTLLDDAGNEIAVDALDAQETASEFTWRLPDIPADADDAVKSGAKKYADGKYYDYTHFHSAEFFYDIVVTAKPSSPHYIGETRQAAFHINPASLYHGPLGSATDHHEATAHFDKVIWGNQSWDYLEALTNKGLVKIKYTGKAIEPKIANPTYLGQPLRNGTGQKYYEAPLNYDYRYVYGNPNPDPKNVRNFDCINVTGSKESNLASMTIRYTQGGDFYNSSIVFFEITPADIKSDVKVTGLKASYPYTGKKVCPNATLTYNGMKLKKGTDYTVVYRSNVNAGKASVTFTGKGNYKGTVTKYFTIAKIANPLVAKPAMKVKNLTVKNLKAKAISFAGFKISKGIGAVTVKLVKNKNTQKFKVDAKGKVTVPKGTKKGTYTVKVQVKAAGNKNYKPKTVNASMKVTVK